MFQTRLDALVGRLAEHLLAGAPEPTFNTVGNVLRTSEKAIVFFLDLSLAHYSGGKRGAASRMMIVVVAKHKVWVRVLTQKHSFLSMKEHMARPEFLAEFENTSNHDACWRTDGIDSPIAGVYFEVAKETNSNVAPVDLHDHSSLNVFSFPLFSECMIQHSRDTKDKNGYRKVLNVVEFQKNQVSQPISIAARSIPKPKKAKKKKGAVRPRVKGVK